MAGTFEIYKDKAGEFRFRLKAADGQVIVTVRGYKTKASAIEGIESVQKNAPGAKIEDLGEIGRDRLRVLKLLEVLHDPKAHHREAFLELTQCLPVLAKQLVQQSASSGIGQRPEHRILSDVVGLNHRFHAFDHT